MSLWRKPSTYAALSSDNEDGGVALPGNLSTSDLEPRVPYNSNRSDVLREESPAGIHLTAVDADHGFISNDKPSDNPGPRAVGHNTGPDQIIDSTFGKMSRKYAEALPMRCNKTTKRSFVAIDPVLMVINRIPASPTLEAIPGCVEEIVKGVAGRYQQKRVREIFEKISSLLYDRAVDGNGDWASFAVQILAGLEIRLQDRTDKYFGSLDVPRFSDNIFALFLWEKVRYMFENYGADVSRGVILLFGHGYNAGLVNIYQLDFILDLCRAIDVERQVKDAKIMLLLDVVSDKMYNDPVAIYRLLYHRERLIASIRAGEQENENARAMEAARHKGASPGEQAARHKGASPGEQAARQKGASPGEQAICKDVAALKNEAAREKASSHTGSPLQRFPKRRHNKLP